jgi:hypothetical protein
MDTKDTKDTNWIKKAFEFVFPFYEKFGDVFLFHSYAFATEKVKACKEIGKAEGLGKAELVPGLLAVLFIDVGLPDAGDHELDNKKIVERFVQEKSLPPDIEKPFQHYLQFLRFPTMPKNMIEQALLDGANTYLGLPDIIERADLLCFETEKANHLVYTEAEWLEVLRKKFVDNPFYTKYARETYGDQRHKNFYELKRRIWRFEEEAGRKKNSLETDLPGNLLSNKETEDLFKIAFRNYLALTSVADRKAALLTQIGSIIVSVIIAYNVGHVHLNPLYVIPVGIILISSVVTIIYAILASRPQENVSDTKAFANSESFFFGSFDRVDRDFRKISLEAYSTGVNSIFKGDKEDVFRQIIEESFQVRRVLSRKFKYLAMAYNVFIAGLILTIVTFLIVSLILSLKR